MFTVVSCLATLGLNAQRKFGRQENCVMDDQEALRLQRRNELYGPDRCLAREAAKQKLVEDHMLQNFQRGAEVVPSNHTFQTTSAGDYGRKEYSRYHRVKPNIKSYVHLGSDSDPSHSVTQSDYASPSGAQFQRHVPLNSNNLVDFAPKYRVDDITGSTQYSNDFDGQKPSALRRGSKVISEEAANFKYHISTHFVLGDNTENSVSETSLSFQGDRDEGTETVIKPSKTYSSVFREGDYNLTTRNVEGHFESTQKRDFTGLPAAGVSTVTRTPYSHVTPKEASQYAVSALRKLLIAKNEEEFQNPRDPTTVNVVKAFAAYDQQKSGSISVDDLKAMCKKFDIPIDGEQVQNLLRECSCEEEGKIDFVKFCEYLTAHREPPKADFTSTSLTDYTSGAQRSQPGGEQDNEHDDFPNRTNFILGYDKKDSGSVYMKDFNPSSTVSKPRFVAGIPCSKVMHEYPVFGSSTSVTSQDYMKHKFRPGRFESLQKIGKKHRTVGVDLSCGPVGDEDHRSSETMRSFTASQHSGHVAQVIIPEFKNYHHLESNRALPHPLNLDTSTEVQCSYKVPMGEEEYAVKKKESLEDRTNRQRENKSTHYIVGYDPPQTETEQTSSFVERKPLDPSVMAAGRPDLPTKGYSILTHDSGETYESRETRETQQLLQQRNYLKNINPRDTVNVNLRKAFLEYDKNLSGAISKDDLKTVCKKMEVDVTDKNLDDIIARCDQKGDGLIDYHEFSLGLSRMQPPGAACLQREQNTTTAQRDFKHPRDQIMDPKQQLVMDLDSKRFETVPLEPSRLFQWAAQPDHLQSIQMKDFKKPESVL